jgi:hypothetical protein
MARSIKFDGKVLALLTGIRPGEENDELNLNKYRKLCGFLRSRDVEKALRLHGKFDIVSASQRRQALLYSSRR